MAIRRYFAQRKRKRYQEAWPIDPSSSEAPANWNGWPEQKQFAFILSHDVESQIGYDQLDKLLQIEESLGFRSVVNFIPKGQYRVTEERLLNLKERGFEVGVHGLYHDGKLYNSLTRFENRARQINQYLKNWGATGFRSPLMHRNLDWLHKLDIAYDSSTFDTDPFEPQPDGLGTIFPKWISNPKSERDKSKFTSASHESTAPKRPSTGYVELPYTLPQDSTLYLLLKEQTIDIWKSKTAWVAKHGGMAFVNVHPDYIDFENTGNQSQYPSAIYADFLKHVKREHADQYWHTIPNEVANYFRNCDS